MAQRSHFDKLVEDEQRDIIKALIASAAQGDMARSAFLAGQYQGLQRSTALRVDAARASTDPDDADDL